MISSFSELSVHYDLTTQDWLFAAFAAFLVGVAKSGVKGITIIIVTTLALVFETKSSVGILLPMLMTGDILAVNYYNRHTQWKYLKILLPWMVIGVLIGVWIGKGLDEAVFKHGMAFIILLSVIMMWWWDRRASKEVPNNKLFGGIMGLSAGFTTMVGNLAGAFSNIYFLAMRLPKNEFIGTAAWLFMIINSFKVPFHIFSWKTIGWQSFSINLWLAPVIVLGFYSGLQLVKRIKNHQYRKFILIVTAIGAILIFFK